MSLLYNDRRGYLLHLASQRLLSGGLGLAIVLVSSYVQRRQPLFEAEVTFWPTHIEVRPSSGALAETYD